MLEGLDPSQDSAAHFTAPDLPPKEEVEAQRAELERTSTEKLAQEGLVATAEMQRYLDTGYEEMHRAMDSESVSTALESFLNSGRTPEDRVDFDSLDEQEKASLRRGVVNLSQVLVAALRSEFQGNLEKAQQRPALADHEAAQ